MPFDGGRFGNRGYGQGMIRPGMVFVGRAVSIPHSRHIVFTGRQFRIEISRLFHGDEKMPGLR
jgi:plasmid stabilization system protein ParE